MRALFPDVESQVGAGALTHIKSAELRPYVRTDRMTGTNEQMPIRIRKASIAASPAVKMGGAVLLVALMCAPRFARAELPLAQRSTRSGQRETKAVAQARVEQFLTCASTERCPDAVRSECVDLYGGVQRSIPTVVFTVTASRGATSPT